VRPEHGKYPEGHPHRAGIGGERRRAQFVSMYQKQADDLPARGEGLVRHLALGLRLADAAAVLRPALAAVGRPPGVLFDLEAQRFYIFGLLLYPQDLIFLAALLVLSALALFFFTAVAGRLWCGYTCPQTVYTEIFMWVERKIEGDRIARMRLDQAPWGAEQDLPARAPSRRPGWPSRCSPASASSATSRRSGNWRKPWWAWTCRPGTLFWILFYGAATYGNAGFLREQMCKYMCPYARFQSALIDKDSLIITYDAARGDPRGSRSRKADAAAQGWATASTARCACRSAPPASTSATGCRTSASAARPASTCATT
jgi:polyferredoxin